LVDAGEVTTVLRTISFSHPNTVVETDLVEHLNLTELIDHHFDFSNLLQQTTIRVFEKIDGITYRNMSTKIFPDDYEDGTKGVVVILDGSGRDMKITLKSGIAEGSAKNIPASVRDEIRV